MTWAEKWERMDPCSVLERKQAQQQRKHARSKQGKQERARAALEDLFKGEDMTQDESEQIEDLLDIWYDYERRYMPALGLPRVSVSCRNHEPERGETHATGEDRDDLLNQIKAESVAACIDELHYLQRAAISVHMRNKRVKAQVFRNPRIEDQHRAYQDAKLALLPKLRRKDLVR